jgi:hypothetical protein
MADEDDDAILDYSAVSPGNDGQQLGDSALSNIGDVNPESFGMRTGKGQFILKDLDDEVRSILKDAQSKDGETSKPSSGLVGSSFSTITGLFRNVVGGKVLTQEDLDKAMKGMEEHLIKKNVAREAAVRLCEGVQRELVGVKTGNFESKTSPSIYLTFILTKSRCGCCNPYSNDFCFTKNPNSNNISRFTTLNRSCQQPNRLFKVQTSPLCHLNCWS